MKKSFLTTLIALGLFYFGVSFSAWYAPETENPISSMKVVSLGNIPSTQTLMCELTDQYATGKKTLAKQYLAQKNLYTSQIIRISAVEQTAGVGQHGRGWQSPPGNVYVTFLFPWPEDKADLRFFVPQVTSVAMVETVKSFDLAGTNVQLKWINDLLLNGKKAGGVLCKAQGVMSFYKEGDALDTNHNALVVGIGINVNMSNAVAQERFNSLDDTMKIPFTSMHIETGKTFSVDEVLTRLTENLVRHYKTLLNQQNSFGTTFSPLINRSLAYRGQKVHYMDTGESTQTPYTLVGIDGEGQAILADVAGNAVKKLSGRIRPIE